MTLPPSIEGVRHPWLLEDRQCHAEPEPESNIGLFRTRPTLGTAHFDAADTDRCDHRIPLLEKESSIRRCQPVGRPTTGIGYVTSDFSLLPAEVAISSVARRRAEESAS